MEKCSEYFDWRQFLIERRAEEYANYWEGREPFWVFNWHNFQPRTSLPRESAGVSFREVVLPNLHDPSKNPYVVVSIWGRIPSSTAWLFKNSKTNSIAVKRNEPPLGEWAALVCVAKRRRVLWSLNWYSLEPFDSSAEHFWNRVLGLGPRRGIVVSSWDCGITMRWDGDR